MQKDIRTAQARTLFTQPKKRRAKAKFEMRKCKLTGEEFMPTGSAQIFANKTNAGIYAKLKKEHKEKGMAGKASYYMRKDPLTGEWFLAKNGNQKFQKPENCTAYHNQKRTEQEKKAEKEARYQTHLEKMRHFVFSEIMEKKMQAIGTGNKAFERDVAVLNYVARNFKRAWVKYGGSAVAIKPRQKVEIELKQKVLDSYVMWMYGESIPVDFYTSSEYKTAPALDSPVILADKIREYSKDSNTKRLEGLMAKNKDRTDIDLGEIVAFVTNQMASEAESLAKNVMEQREKLEAEEKAKAAAEYHQLGDENTTPLPTIDAIVEQQSEPVQIIDEGGENERTITMGEEMRRLKKQQYVGFVLMFVLGLIVMAIYYAKW